MCVTMIYSSFSLFLVILWIGSISCAVYHIIPSLDHHCHVESCLTLSSFVANSTMHLDSNTSLIFQPGNYTMHSQVNVTNAAEFSMISYSAKQSSVAIICDLLLLPDSLFIFEAVDYVKISNLKFLGCEIKYFSAYRRTLIIEATVSNLIFLECTFEGNKGISLISAKYSNVTITQSTFRGNDVIHILSYLFCNAMFVNSTFTDNESGYASLLEFNAALTTPRHLNSLIFTGCEFRNNYNSATDSIIGAHNSEISIIGTKFIGNKAVNSFIAYRSVVSINRSVFKNNCAYGSAIKLSACTVDIVHSVYDSNQGGKFHLGGALSLYDRTLIHVHGSEFKNNTATIRGGAIFSTEESVTIFHETCILAYNHAEQGGAIYLDQSAQCFIAYGATVIIANNTASRDGGGIYLDDANLTLHNHAILQIFQNKAITSGGGIYTLKFSSINPGFRSLTNKGQTSNSVIYFHKNEASQGGGLYLGLNSTVWIYRCLQNTINFDENSAQYGGAVYVFSNLSTMLYPECFFQSRSHPVPIYYNNQTNDTQIYSKEVDFPFDSLSIVQTILAIVYSRVFLVFA